MKIKGGAVIALIGVFGFTYFMVAAINYCSYSYIDKVKIDGFVNIPTNSTLESEAATLQLENFIKDSSDYLKFAQMMRMEKVNPGRYKLTKGMSYKELMTILTRGYQTPVRTTFIPALTFNQIAGRVSKSIEADSVSLVEAFKNDSIMSKYNLDSLTASTIFIPNTYEFYWNTSAEQFIDRMYKEYQDFWAKDGREERLKVIGLSKLEVMTLASIVYGETKYTPEMSTVAGVYMNRLNKGMKLQADPTVVYAHQDFSIRRVTYKHLEINSPYNTYKYKGLPPSPINFPAISAIDAVLHYKDCKYLFFCASEKFDGTHNFAVTYSQHTANARKYSRELTKRGIR